MTEEGFWEIVNSSREPTPDGEGTMDAQLERLSDSLRALPPDEIESFRDRLLERMDQAYRWDLWGAADLIAEGCSDDGFADFRSWVISMGRSAYYGALENPESLAETATLPSVEDVFFEEFQYVPLNVYEEVTGQVIPDPLTERPTSPTGRKWADDSELRRMLPRLAARFGRTPL
jgi:hypothetical protein